MLEITSLSGGYRAGIDVFTDLSLSVHRGKAVGIIGRNGAGKTCLALTVAGLLKQSGGDVLIDSASIIALNTRGRVANGLALVPEGRQIFPQLSVRENLQVAAFGAGRKLDKASIDSVEAKFPVLGRKANMPAASLSGGEQQFLAIARALIQKPSVLVLDEPTLGLSPVAIDGLGDSLLGVLDDGVAVLLMEQNPDLLERTCQEVHLISEGSIVQTFSAAQLADRESVAAAMLSQ